MSAEVRRLGKTYLNFKARQSGDYTLRQTSAAAAYTMFCHAEFESYLEGWATRITDFADDRWKSTQKVTRPLAHLCTFAVGRNELSNVPSKDVWSEQFFKAISQHRDIVRRNDGIKEVNVCKLFGPIGFDLRQIDSLLLADLTAFGVIRGDHAHQSHRRQMGVTFDPFGRQAKVKAIVTQLIDLDNKLTAYELSF